MQRASEIHPVGRVLFKIYIWPYFEIDSCTILLVNQPCWFLSNCRFVFFLITWRCLNPWIIWCRTCVLFIVPLISVSGHFVNLIRGRRNWEVFQFVVCKKHLLYLILRWYQKVAIHFVFLMCTGPSLLFPYLFLNNKDLVVDGFLLWLPPLGSSCKMKWLQLIVQWTRREIVTLPHSQTAQCTSGEEITDCRLQGQPSLMDTTCGRFSPEVLLSCKWNGSHSQGRVI